MSSVIVNELELFDADLEAILKEMPDARRELHENLTEILKKEVDEQIDASGLNDASGKVKGWQEPRVGSKGGYAAIRPEKGRNLVGANSPGAITNYLEFGHKVRDSKADKEERDKTIAMRHAEKQHGRHKKKTIINDNRQGVKGYHFYFEAQRSVESKAVAEVERFADAMKQKLEG
jgi:hypothetical protein